MVSWDFQNLNENKAMEKPCSLNQHGSHLLWDLTASLHYKWPVIVDFPDHFI